MSTICGLFSKKGSVNKYNTSGLFQKSGIYTHDTASIWQNEAVFLGCHLKKIVPESEYETLPYFDKESKLIITADAIIDNRDELSDLLDLKDDKNTSDSKYILEAYKKWGYNCPEYLIGDFVFVIWDDKNKELFCCRDHLAENTFYFYNSEDFFCFSTLINPIFEITGIEKKINDVYAAPFLWLPLLKSEFDNNLTIYTNIFQLHPASCMVITNNKIKKWQYWDIEKTDELKFNNDHEYEQAFMDIFSKVVRCRLRSKMKKGVMLSGGLDSGAVASVMAPELKRKGEELYTFTQIPFKGYEDWLPENKLADETEYVKSYSENFDNLKSYYLSCDGTDPIMDIDEMLDLLEQPYKAFENTNWINEIMLYSKNIGVDMLYDGQGGNATISWGKFFPYIKYLFQNRNYIRYFNEIKEYSALRNINTVKVMFRSILDLLPYKIKKEYQMYRNTYRDKSLIVPANCGFCNKKQKDEFKKYIDEYYILTGNSLEQRMKRISFNGCNHIGSLKKKLSLKYGVKRFDPTRDIRIVQFCLNLPENQYVRNGEERRFIRHAMKGIMPDKVRLNKLDRGRQGADWIQRIRPRWNLIISELNSIGENIFEKKYLDIDKIKENINKFKHSDCDRTDIPELKMLIRALIFSKFIRKNF